GEDNHEGAEQLRGGNRRGREPGTPEEVPRRVHNGPSVTWKPMRLFGTNGYSSYFASTLSAPSRICTFDSTSNCTGPLGGTHEAMYPTTLAPESNSKVTRWLTMSRSFL